MTVKFKLTKPVEYLGPYDLIQTCPEDLCNLVIEQSRLVNYTPRAIFQPGVVLDWEGNGTGDSWLGVWEYELTERQQQMLNVAGAELHNLWQGFQVGNNIIDRQIKWTQENKQ